MSDPRAQTAVDYVTAHEADVDAYVVPYTEGMTLRTIVAGTPSPPGGLMGSVLQTTLMRQTPTVATQDDAYQLTHNVFFATDFGRVALDAPAVLTLVGSLLATYASKPDLLGELLLCQKYLGGTVDPDQLAAFGSAWQAAVDAPFTADDYHLVIIGGLLFAAL